MNNVTSTSPRQTKSNKGKGPRFHKPSATRILERINERLCDNPYLDASDIEVSVDNGVVILNGTVNSRDEKKLTQEIAEEIPGVEDVDNRIHVTLKGI